jgi:hypothetical protein
LQVSLPAEPVELLGDRARLIQLLCNLLTNAAKYTPSGGRIELKATTNGGTLTLSVTDNGIGIPRERLGEIFDLFAQVDRSGSGRWPRSVSRWFGRSDAPQGVRGLRRSVGGSVISRASQRAATGPALVRLRVPPPHRHIPFWTTRDAARACDAAPDRGADVFTLTVRPPSLNRQRFRPDVMIPDLGMPTVSGYDVARAFSITLGQTGLRSALGLGARG